MRTRTWVSLVVLLASLTACHGARTHAAQPKTWASSHEAGDGDLAHFESRDSGTVASLDDVTNGLQSNASRSIGDDPRLAPQPTAAAERMLTYHGEIRVEVARPDDAVAQFLAQVKEWGGYLQSQQGAVITVRLPAARFDEAFVKLRAAGRVLGESRRADDVTEEFVDLGIRLDNAKKARDRLLEVLKLADKVEDILKVEAEGFEVQRPSPVEVVAGERAAVLVNLTSPSEQPFAALVSTASGGEIVAVGESLWWNQCGKSRGFARLVRNLLSRAPRMR